MTNLEMVTKNQENAHENETCECSKCDNDDCKCHQIMVKLSEIIDLTNQIGHTELYNTLLTIFCLLQNYEDHKEDLLKINNICQEVYKDLNPKEMGHTIN
jgi:hypothetical protein